MMDKLAIVVKASGKITVAPEYRKLQLSPLKYGYIKGRIVYLVMVLLNTKDLVRLSKDNLSQLQHLVDRYPEAIPSVFWPYQCSVWNLTQRVHYLHNHFQVLSQLDKCFAFLSSKQKSLTDLDEVYPGMSLVFDRHGLFLREGMIVLNIFVDHERVFTLAFSLVKSEGGCLNAIIGAIQGRRKECITGLYRSMTKKTYGIRPRDLMVEIFQILCKAIGVARIYAIRENRRQHRHYFYSFKKNKPEVLSINYDEVWRERGGMVRSDEFYELPVLPSRKSLSTIIAKKRSMYRKRYGLLERIENTIMDSIYKNQ
jgi:uncharacterized protein VirK/YbjX